MQLVKTLLLTLAFISLLFQKIVTLDNPLIDTVLKSLYLIILVFWILVSIIFKEKIVLKANISHPFLIISIRFFRQIASFLIIAAAFLRYKNFAWADYAMLLGIGLMATHFWTIYYCKSNKENHSEIIDDID